MVTIRNFALAMTVSRLITRTWNFWKDECCCIGLTPTLCRWPNLPIPRIEDMNKPCELPLFIGPRREGVVVPRWSWCSHDWGHQVLAEPRVPSPGYQPAHSHGQREVPACHRWTSGSGPSPLQSSEITESHRCRR